MQDEHRVPASQRASALRARRDDEVLASRDALASGDLVLVLDNCEHVVEPSAMSPPLFVAACPGLTVLATSCEPLGLTAEHLLRLGPLPVPEQGTADVTGVPAVEAFMAYGASPDLVLKRDDAKLVGDVVRRLDGLPLALELPVAGWAPCRWSTCRLAWTGRRPTSAGRRSADARHRPLRDAIDWSYRALDDDEAALLCAPSVPSPAASTWPPPSDWPTGRAYGPIPPGRWSPADGRCWPWHGAARAQARLRDRPGLLRRPARRHRAPAPRRVRAGGGRST